MLDHDVIERLDFQPMEWYWGRWMGTTIVNLMSKKLYEEGWELLFLMGLVYLQ